MINWFRKFLSGANDRYVDGLRPIVAEINALESEYSALQPEAWVERTAALKAELASGASTDTVLPRAFALVRAAAASVLGQRHYDVQLLGGIVLSKGQIAEMRTGEGKTLTATLAVYTQALHGKGVHVVTVNDYLARRDAAWMGRVYAALGLTVGVIEEGASFLFDPKGEVTLSEDVETAAVSVDGRFLRPCSRKEAYNADITYGTNSEFGFDYLRDNMSTDRAQLLQRGFHYALIDEVDSILIDEARTPLIISGAATDAAETYYRFADIAKHLQKDQDYTVEEKHRHVALTDMGVEKVQQALGIDDLYTVQHIPIVHHIENALRAKALFILDVQYVVQEGQVKIVDEFTGRIMHGRRYSDGLHQAIEAKENVEIQKESSTLATITIQNYFRQYELLAGMTGTAMTEAEEFSKIYSLEVVAIPSHRGSQRLDLPDAIFGTERGKLHAVVAAIKEAHAKKQPVLVGTVSIAKNELLSTLLSKEGIPHQVLNAKQHEQEGSIIAQAGRLGAVTIATNMAGRGVDIILGGNPFTAEDAAAVRAAGGLFVIGTERHESRRIDNQLRGRTGRQGDVGVTKFFLSLEDDLMRIFGSGRVQEMLERMGLPEDVPIENKMVTRSIATAQKKVEGFNFDTRKHVLEYDNVLNKQREAIYSKRRMALLAERPATVETLSVLGEQVLEIVNGYAHDAEAQMREGAITAQELVDELSVIRKIPDTSAEVLAGLSKEQLGSWFESLRSEWRDVYITQQKTGELRVPEYGFILFERMLWLQTIDQLWVEHMRTMDQLKAGIGLRGYAQREPLVEYQHEAYGLFKGLLAGINERIAQFAFKFDAGMVVETLEPSVFEQPLILNDPTESVTKAPLVASAPQGMPLPRVLPTSGDGGNRAARRKQGR